MTGGTSCQPLALPLVTLQILPRLGSSPRIINLMRLRLASLILASISLPKEDHTLALRLVQRASQTSMLTNKVKQWTAEVNTLAHFATTQPHATFAAYTHELTSRWSYLVQTTPNISDYLLHSLEKVIRTRLLPA